MKNIKLIKTDLYLLLIDEEAGIDINNYIVAEDLSGIAKVKEYEKGHILAIAIFQNIELGISYHQTSDWNKIIAYYPLTEGAKELDLPLLPNPFEEINIEDLSEKANGYAYYGKPLGEKYLAFKEGFIEGYKAASKGQFSLEDIKKAIEMARMTFPTDKLSCDRHSTEHIIQSLSTQKLPSEFIPEYEEIIVDKLVPKMPIDIIKTITNSEGKQELIGTYKY